jgi:hypothetical protein
MVDNWAHIDVTSFTQNDLTAWHSLAHLMQNPLYKFKITDILHEATPELSQNKYKWSEI